MKSNDSEEWTDVIRPVKSWYDLRLKELWNYRDLVMIFVRRDFVSVYKQTILGPIWVLIQPLLTTFVFTVVFAKFARISTAEVPATIFYMTGITAWNYFSSCLTKTSGTFINNTSIFGKVYFPRLAVPLSIVISNLITFLIQYLHFTFTSIDTFNGFNGISFWNYHFFNYYKIQGYAISCSFRHSIAYVCYSCYIPITKRSFIL